MATLTYIWGPLGYGAGGAGGGEWQQEHFGQPTAGSAGAFGYIIAYSRKSQTNSSIIMKRDNTNYYPVNFYLPPWEWETNNISPTFPINFHQWTDWKFPFAINYGLSRAESEKASRTYILSPITVDSSVVSGHYAELKKLSDVTSQSSLKIIDSKIRKKNTTNDLKLVGCSNKDRIFKYLSGISYKDIDNQNGSITVHGWNTAGIDQYAAKVYLLLQGAGGGGGGADNKWFIGNYAAGGGGGAAGGAMLAEFTPADNTSYTIYWEVGAAGAAGQTKEWSTDGENGGSTIVRIVNNNTGLDLCTLTAYGGRGGDGGQHTEPGTERAGAKYSISNSVNEIKILLGIQGGTGGAASPHNGTMSSSGGNPVILENNLGSSYIVNSFDIGKFSITCDVFGKGGERGFFDDSGGAGGGSWLGKGGYYSEDGSEYPYW